MLNFAVGTPEPGSLYLQEIHERTYRDLGFEIAHIGPASVLDRVRELKHALSLSGLER